MENDYFPSAGIPPAALHFEPSSTSASPLMQPNWHSLFSSSMEIQAAAATDHRSPDCFFNPNWDKSTTDQSMNFESALSSLVSSPAASNSNISNETFMIRKLIGKLGNINNYSVAAEILPQSQALLAASSSSSCMNNGNSSTNNSCYSTPLNSPAKPNLPVMNHHLLKEKLPNLGNSMPLSSNVAEFSADPGFAERAARFSTFGSRSFNGRTTQLGLKNAELAYRSNPVMENSKLPRVSSSPSLEALGSQMGNQQNTKPALQCGRSELANSQEEPSVSDQQMIPNGEKQLSNDLNSRKRKSVSKGKAKEPAASPQANAASKKVSEVNENLNSKRSKIDEGNLSVKAEEEAKEKNTNDGGDEKQSKNNNTKPPEPPKDYIHVRARRGQATDSHSLAERVRREKISERMKLLQDLVPGCNKVTGKALMLDEIINYVQSLQRQVEFLSMKLASVNTRLDFNNINSLMSKDIFQSSNNPMPRPIFPLDSSVSAFFGQQHQQNPALHNNISIGTMPQCSSTVDPLDTALCQNLGTQLPPLNGLINPSIVPQFPTLCEDDLQSIVQMGFGQNPATEPALPPQSFHGSNQVSRMKVEL